MALISTAVADFGLREVQQEQGLLHTLSGGFGVKSNGKIFVVKFGFSAAQSQGSSESTETLFPNPEDLTLEIDSKSEIFQGLSLSRRQQESTSFNLSREFGIGLGKSLRAGLEKNVFGKIFTKDGMVIEKTIDLTYSDLAEADKMCNKAQMHYERTCLVTPEGLQILRTLQDPSGRYIFNTNLDPAWRRSGAVGSFWNYKVVLCTFDVPALEDYKQQGFIFYDKLAGAWGAEKKVFLDGPKFDAATRTYKYLGSLFYGAVSNTNPDPTAPTTRKGRFVVLGKKNRKENKNGK